MEGSQSMKILIIFIAECIFGFILFARTRLNGNDELIGKERKVSVIVPARNEEKNLPHILGSLKKQTYIPHEIIVVDDFSSDATGEIANKYGVTVIQNTELPEGWTGKNWAVWNGSKRSTGDILVFLDADVRLKPDALEKLLKSREKSGGVISIIPYHHTEKVYERLSLVVYLLGVFAFTSPFERRSSTKGLYGSCIVATREDYEKINGHDSVRAEILDDLNLGKRFSEAGIKVENFIGCGFVSFRMYPNGIKSELEGFGKGAVLSTATLRPATTILIAFWLVGLFAVGLVTPFLLIAGHPWSLPFLIGYLIYTAQIIYFLKYTGSYGIFMPVLHCLSSLFFILIMMYSIYRVSFMGSVSWKGRQIKVGGRKNI